LHQVGDLFELNVKLRCQKVNIGLLYVCQYSSPKGNIVKIFTSTQGKINIKEQLIKPVYNDSATAKTRVTFGVYISGE